MGGRTRDPWDGRGENSGPLGGGGGQTGIEADLPGEVRGRPESDRGSRQSGIGPRFEADRNRTEVSGRAESDRASRQTGIGPRFEADRNRAKKNSPLPQKENSVKNKQAEAAILTQEAC